MQEGFLKVAALAPELRVADPIYNANIMIEQMEEAHQNGAKLIVFPELSITGYTCHDLFLQDCLLENSYAALAMMVEASDGMDAIIFVGMPYEVDGKLYNVAAVINAGDLVGIVPKRNIPTYAEYYETRHFAKGNEEVIVLEYEGNEIPFGTNQLFTSDAIKGLSIGVEICEDVWVAHTPSTDHVKAGATVIVNLSASNETVGKDEYRELLVKSTSARLVCGYIYASAGNGESTQDVVFGAHHMIAENGTMLMSAKRFQNEIIYSELDIMKIRMERRRINTFEVDLNNNYLKVPTALVIERTELSRTFGKFPFVPANMEKRAKRCEEILMMQSMGLKKRLQHTHAKKVVIGISGGLDSTLALLVACKAFELLELPKSGIIAVTMPCFGTTNRTYDNACSLSKIVGATLLEIDIKDSVNQHFKDLGKDSSVHDVTYENCQARERTQILMDLANKENALVIGTGDMSELALGWATYNGDHMSMYGVNVGVPKTLVRHLVRYYADTNNNSELSAILNDVLDTPVSPELLPPTDGEISQKTEDLVGPYELHDFFLYYMFRCGYSPIKVYRVAIEAFRDTYESEIIYKWLTTFYRRFFSQQFKRSCLPDGPKIGSVALSPRGDLRMPSDACVDIWLKELDLLKEDFD